MVSEYNWTLSTLDCTVQTDAEWCARLSAACCQVSLLEMTPDTTCYLIGCSAALLDSDWSIVTFAITVQHTNSTRCIMFEEAGGVTDHGWRGGGAGAAQFRHDLIEAADNLHKPSSHRPHPAQLTL